MENYEGSIGGTGLTLADFNDLSAAAQRVFDLLKDGQWHTADEILNVANQREGLRRMREIRQRGLVVETRRVEENKRAFEYRLVHPSINPWKGAF